MTSWNNTLSIDEARQLLNSKGAMWPKTEWNRLTVAMATDEILSALHGVPSMRGADLLEKRNALCTK